MKNVYFIFYTHRILHIFFIFPILLIDPQLIQLYTINIFYKMYEIHESIFPAIYMLYTSKKKSYLHYLPHTIPSQNFHSLFTTYITHFHTHPIHLHYLSISFLIIHNPSQSSITLYSLIPYTHTNNIYQDFDIAWKLIYSQLLLWISHL